MAGQAVTVQSRKQQQRRAAKLLTAVGAALVTGTASTASAAQHVYTPAGSADQWSAGTNWSTTPVSAANTQLTIVGDNATVISDGQISSANNDIPGSFLLNILDLQGTGPATTDASVTISGNTLEFVDNGAALPVVNLNAVDGGQDLDYAVSNALTLSGSTTFTGNGTSAFSFTGPIGGAGALAKSGTSTLVLSGTNGYTGGTTINAGVLRATQATALAAGQVTVNSGGTLSVSAGGFGQWTDLEVDALRTNATFNAGSTLGVNVDSGNTFAYASNITGAQTLAKTAGGTLILSGTNTHTGGTTIGGGILSVSSADNLGGAASVINFTGGVLQVNGTALTNLDGNAVNSATFNGGFNIADAGHTFTFSQSISGAGGLSKSGPGTLVLTGANTHAGSTTLSGGTLAVTNGTQLGNGSGSLNLGNAANPVTLQVSAPAATIANAVINMDGNTTGPVTIAGASNINFTGEFRNTESNGVINFTNIGSTTFSGPMYLSDGASNRTLRIGGAGNVTLSGIIANSPTTGLGSLRQQGSGILTLTNANTYTSITTVVSGTLAVANNAALGASTLNLGDNTGLATIRASGGPVSIANATVMNSGAGFPAQVDGADPLTFSGVFTNRASNGVLNVNSNATTTFSGTVRLSDSTSNRTFRFGGSGNTLISAVVTNHLSASSSLTQQGTGTLTLTNANAYSGNTSVTSGSLGIGNDAALGTSTLLLGNNTAVATVFASGAARTIANNVTLNSSAANPGTIGGSENLTLNGAFSNGNSHGYLAVNNTAATMLAGPVYLSNNVANSRTLHVTGTGDVRITGPVADANGTGLPGSLEHNGSGTLTVSGAMNHTGVTAATSGKLVLENSLTTSSSVTASGTGTIELASNGTASRVISAATVSIGATAKIDLKDNKLITTSAAGTATEGVYNGLQGQVQSAFNFGSWDGPGLTTSMPDALAGIATVGIATGEQIRGLGPTDTDSWAGQTISGASTIAMYTYAGDANLDGQVDAGDYGILDAFIQVDGATGYGNGDFNYDGFIDAADYGTIDNSIQFQGPPIFTGGGAGGASINSAGLSGVTAVPEPASLSVIGLAAVGLMARRRRKTN